VEGYWALLATTPQGLVWNTDWSETAYRSDEVITWQDFPDLNLLGEGGWQTTGYNPVLGSPAKGKNFSPDGCRLAFTGTRQDTSDTALFVIDRCP
jgi:hypothetical protein